MTTTWDDPATPWRSGPWTLELRDDEIADIAYDRRVVVRSIRAVVRDADWNTAGWTIDAVDEGERMLRIGLRSTGLGSDVRGGLTVETDGDRLAVTFDAVSHGDFRTNRTGLVVLHPPGLAGSPLRVAHPGGSDERTAFPRAISAHQPVFDIAGLGWRSHGLDVDLTFEGDVFEMEDQRNWTDASFKTYSRPLALPFPYTLAGGEHVRQRVEVRVAGDMTDVASDDAEPIVLVSAGSFPRVGVSASTAPDPEPALPAIIGSELLVELDLATPTWKSALHRAAARGVPLDVRVVLPDPDPAALKAFAEALEGLDVARVAVFHPVFHVSTTVFVQALREALRTAGVTATVVGGSRSHFTELNREGSRLPDDLAAIVVTVTPLFHALSTAQLIESVAMQRLVAQQTVSYADGLPVHVGPVTLRPRFNDVATGPQPAPGRSDLSEGYGAQFTGAVDPRQSRPELAAWVVASAAALAVPGVSSIAYFEEWGPRGVYDEDGRAAPTAEALRALSDLAGGALLTGASPDGLVWAVGSRSADGAAVLAANLDQVSRTLEIVLPLPRGGHDTVRATLDPCTWVRIDRA